MWTAPETDALVKGAWQPPTGDTLVHAGNFQVESMPGINPDAPAALTDQAATAGAPQKDWGGKLPSLANEGSMLTDLKRGTVELREEMLEPRVGFPRLEIVEGDPAALTVGKQVANILIGLPEFMTSHAGVLGLVAAPVAPATTAGVFGVDMLHTLSQQVTDAYENWDQMTDTQKQVAVTDMAATGAFVGLLGKGAARSLEARYQPGAAVGRELAKEVKRAELPAESPMLKPEVQVGRAAPRAAAPPLWRAPEGDTLVRRAEVRPEPLPTELEYAGGEMPRTAAQNFPETITGSNVRKGTEMPAEVGATPPGKTQNTKNVPAADARKGSGVEPSPATPPEQSVAARLTPEEQTEFAALERRRFNGKLQPEEFGRYSELLDKRRADPKAEPAQRAPVVPPEQSSQRAKSLPESAMATDKQPPEKIRAAAIRLPDGAVFEGPIHIPLFDKADQTGRYKSGEVLSAKEGFVTTRGRFVDRDEAFAIAKRQAQIKSQVELTTLSGGKELHARNTKFSKVKTPSISAEGLSDNSASRAGQSMFQSAPGKPGEGTTKPTPATAAAPKAEPAQRAPVVPPETKAAGPRKGEIGGKMASGDVVLTLSGRQTTPFPKLSFGTERKTSNTLKQVDAWLRENAIAEARSRGDDFNARMFEAEKGKTIPQASKDAMEYYLFGEQPQVIKSPLKPVTPPAAVAKVEQHVAQVASKAKAATPEPALSTTTGPRAAKEIKSELVQRLEEALAEAPDQPKVLSEFKADRAKVDEYLRKGLVRAGDFNRSRQARALAPEAAALFAKYGIDVTGKHKSGIGNANPSLSELGAKIDSLLKAQLGQIPKIQIQIPGDGDFRLVNTKEALGEVLKKARKLDTSAGKEPTVQRSGISKEDAEWVAKNKQTVPTPEAGINTGALGEAGMGGAKPGEFRANPTTATGIRNAVVDQERVRRGLPPAMEAARKDFGTVWDEAMARVDQDPTVTERLVSELQQRARPLTDVENAQLLHRQIELQNEYGKLTRELAQAFDDSQMFPNRLEAVETLKARVAETSDKLLAIYDVGKAVGTEQGRGLASRKMLAYEDYSLAKMELEKRAAKGGAPLTDAERAQITKLQQRIEETQRQFDAYREAQEAARANRMTDEAIADLQKELAARPNYDSRIVKIAEEIVGKLEKQAESASARLKAKFARTNTGLDPTIIYDLGVVGAAKIARAGLDFGKFSAAMIADYGDGVKQYLQAAWERANLHLENEGAKYGDKAPLVKAALRKRDALGKRENVVAGLKKGKEEGIPVQMAADYIRKLAESFVEAGIKTREALVDAVHGVLTKEVGLEITRRETMDAISGYGKFKPLNPDAIKATLRDLRGQMQQVAKLEDIQARKPMQKTGVERRVPSNEERRLLQQVNEAKRRFGVVVSDPARQLKSALDAIKTRLKNQIADIEYQINTKERIVKTKTPSPFDAETKLLESRRDELRAQLDELLPKPEMTPEQQVARVARGIERSIADFEARIAAQDVRNGPVKAKLSTPQLEALRARRDALKAEWEELRDVLDPGRRERADLAALKARLAQSTANYRERLAKHDFTKRKRNDPPKLDAEAQRLAAENEIAKREYHTGLIKDRMANRTLGQRVYAGVKESLNLPRNMLSSWDVSAVLRQGGFIALGNPGRAFAALGPMFRSLASEKRAVMVEKEILSRPNAPLYKQSKLYLAPHEALHLSAMEEAIMSRLAGKIPGLRASNRAYITFLNRLRADSFDALLASVARKDGNLTQPEMQAIANYINVATGRGDLGKASAAAETLATVFFSPRLVASRFQLIAGQPLYQGTARTRAAIAQEYGKFLAGLGVVYGLGVIAGATVETDARSSDFGKLRFGDTRVDVLAGLAQTSVLLTRLGTGETKTTKGDVRSIRGDAPYGAQTADDVIASFLRSKLSPVVGTGVDILQGENVVGDPVTPQTVAVNMTVPLSFRDIYDVMQDQGMARGTVLGILSLFGWGLQHYEPRNARPWEQDEIVK